MRSFIRRYPAACYFTLAFGISWGGILAVIRGGPIPAPPDDAHRLFGLVYLAMLAGPSVAGIAMTGLVGGPDGLRDYRARLVKWRVGRGWYAVALFTAPLALALTSIVLSQFSVNFVPAMFDSGAIDPAGPIQAGSVASLLVLAVGVGIGAGFFEELGWTGFAVPMLRRRLVGTSTGILVGVLWGGWHFLAVWWGSSSSFGSVPVPLFMIVALFTFLLPYRVLMVRVYERTRSTLVAVLMHASLTTSMIILGPAVNGADSVVYNLVFATTLWGLVGLTTRARGKRDLVRPRRPIQQRDLLPDLSR